MEVATFARTSLGGGAKVRSCGDVRENVLNGELSKSTVPSRAARFSETTTFARTCLKDAPGVRSCVRENAAARHPGDCVSRTHGVDVRGFGCWWAHRSRVLTNAATWAFLIGRRFPTNIAPSSALLLAPPDTFLRTWLLLPGAPALASRETCATTPHRFSSQHVLTNVADSPGPRFFASRSRDVLANAATTPAAFHSSLCRAALAASAAIPADSSSPLSTSELSRR
jgi:hypothetical protein